MRGQDAEGPEEELLPAGERLLERELNCLRVDDLRLVDQVVARARDPAAARRRLVDAGVERRLQGEDEVRRRHRLAVAPLRLRVDVVGDPHRVQLQIDLRGELQLVAEVREDRVDAGHHHL